MLGVRSKELISNALRHWPSRQKLIVVAPTSSAHSQLNKLNETVEWMQMSTKEAISVIPDNSMDFVYVDDGVNYCSVMEFLQLYWPKLKVGGVMSGHDAMNAAEAKKVYNEDWSVCTDGRRMESAVKGAVIDFARLNKDATTVTGAFVTKDFKSWGLWKIRPSK